jgi:hypothetical protein
VAAITGFAKLLDPGSVVRPAEAENVERAQGIYAQLQMHIRSLTEKRSLSPQAQDEMRRLTHELASIYVDWGNKHYDQLARTYGNVYRYEDIGLRKPSYRGQLEQVTEGEKASNAAQGIPLEGMSREEVLERVRNIPGAPKPPPAFGTWWDSNVGW